MNTKRLIIVSFFALMTISTIQAAGVIVLQDSTPIISFIILIPTLSWTDSYLSVQIDGLSSKATLKPPMLEDKYGLMKIRYLNF
ncbi:hypothetical protein MF1_02680 [Bartonella quintana]|uniref:hypothetical protein n=1 Tax=Bartonella quintana TaxID=803 RepID=UPI0002E171AA|nr:hypothetical protein [Bartonella quintana]BBL53010.1 hypothetical protein MF1_02680 [Bartonella quintana]